MNSTSSRAGKVLEKTVKIVGLAKDLVGSAVSAEPHATIAWAGVCLFLPLLLNPSQQDDARRKGLEELPFLIEKYSLIERICTTKISNPESASIQHTLSNAIVELYTKILSFQAEAICQSNQSMVKGYFRKVFQVDNWENMHHDIISTEGRCWGLAQAIDGNFCSKSLEDFSIKLAELYTVGSEFLQASRQTCQAVINLGRESEQREKTKEEEACLQAFRSGNLYEEQKNITPDRVPGTCNWLLKDSTFIDWKQGRGSGLLWISADPGCGKSVLSKAFVDDRLVAATQSTVICYFFFKDVSVYQRSPTKAIAALLHQIFSSKTTEHLLGHAMKVWKADGKELCNIADSMWAIPGAIAADPTAGDIFCVIDALDECDGVLWDYFVRKLTRLVSRGTQCHIRFVVTSRPYHEIQGIFEELQIDSESSFLRIAGEEESEAISSDIEMVIKHKFLRLPKLNDVTKQHLINRLQKMQNKTYLWLYLIWEIITTEASITGRHENFDKVLDKLPDSVGNAYEAILNKSPDRSRTEKLLHVVVGAERPLTTEEINVVMHINVDYTGTQSFKHAPLEDAHDYPAILRSLCGLFIRIEGGKVYLIHQTAKEFLVETQSEKRKEIFWKHCLQPDTSHRLLAEACISYLFLDGFDASSDTHYGIDKHLRTIRAKRLGCFLDYSASFWTVHYKRAASFIDHATIVKYCSPLNRRKIWHRMNSNTDYTDDTDDADDTDADDTEADTDDSWGFSMYTFSKSFKPIDATSLMLISYLNLYEAGSHILSAPGFDKHELEASNGLFTPLILAIGNGSIEMVQLLIQSGADANYYLNSDCTPLEVAVQVADLAILQSVLEVAVDERTGDSFPKSALESAILGSEGDEIYIYDVIPMLLNSIVRPMVEGYLEYAPQLAVELESLEIVELLINVGADPNYEIMGKGRWCILNEVQIFYWGRDAAGIADIVKLLLSKTETLPCEFVESQLIKYADVVSDKVDLLRLMLNHPRHHGLILDGRQSPVVFAALYANMKSMEPLINGPHDINKCKAVMDWDKIYEAWKFVVKKVRFAVKKRRGGMPTPETQNQTQTP